MSDRKSQVVVYVSSDCQQWMREESERLGIPMSTVARWIIEGHVAKKLKREIKRTMKELDAGKPPSMESGVEL